MNYDELVKELREMSVDWHERPPLSAMLNEAADAIEQLQKSGCPHYIRNVHDRGDDSLCRKFGCEVKELPRWIPVTERLPDAKCGEFSKNVFVTDGQDVAISSWFNGDDFASYWSYTGIGEVTHYMPLPEPPKEET